MPDVSNVTFLLRKDPLVKDSGKPEHAFADFPRMEKLSASDLKWLPNQNEDSLFSKMDFFEIEKPVESENAQEIFESTKSMWWGYYKNPELYNMRQKLLEGNGISTKYFEDLTTKMVDVLINLSNIELKKKSFSNRESL